MGSRKHISAYTPSNTDPKILKRIFVQRETLLEKIVDRLTVSMTSGDKHHILLVGPRGSGKTHLVSLVAWELRQKENLSDVMRMAWLGEDDTFSGLIHLAFAIAKALAAEYPDEFPEDFRSDVRGLPPDDAALSVLNTVIRNLKHRQLLIMTENLDQTFSGLGDSGQKKLRAFLQETRRIATLATSQQLFAGVSSRKESFFGFFDVQHLKPLTVDDAAMLIRKIAVEQQRSDLVKFLDSTASRYRVRALHHLAGGNHRMYVLLSEFLTAETLDDLVLAFEALAEKMTPYFQERLRSLPDQQRQLVQCLCDAEGAMTVKEVAEETFIAEGNCSKQLGNLKAKGYVRSEKRGKESYYDMAEPLMRLCLEVKNQRGRPLKLVARFLKAWFPIDVLQQFIGSPNAAARTAEYCAAALQLDRSFETAINEQLAAEIKKMISQGEYEQARSLAEELAESEPFLGLHYQGWTAHVAGDFRVAVTKATEIIEHPGASVDQVAGAIRIRGLLYGQQGETESALADFTTVIEMPNAPVDQVASALNYRGVTHRRQGETNSALTDFTSVIELPDAQVDLVAGALGNRGVAYWQKKEWRLSLSDFAKVLALTGVSRDVQTRAMFLIPEPMIAIDTRENVVEALRKAFETGDKESKSYGGTPHDLLYMILNRGPSEWGDYVADVAPLYIRYGQADKLGQGITQSIQYLDEGGFSETQLDLWNDAWQKAGRDCEDLQIPLACLDAAVDVMKSDPKTDRPLFRLPLEIRQLVRPLLNKSLGPEDD
ncbi:MAG: winged helix-turn-helix transcriptional regulator [Planctomycetaceae bacterium]